MEPYWDSIERIIKESDVILNVLDARLVEYSRNEELEKLIKKIGRPVIFVINKADLVSKEALELSVDKLKQEGIENAVYVSNRRAKTIKNLIAMIKKVFDKYGKRSLSHKDEMAHRIAKGGIVIGVVGYPNVGKSSVINAINFKKKAQVSSRAGTTHGIHWISGKGIKMIDTPGVIPLKHVDDTIMGMIGARGTEKLKEKDTVAMRIIEMFLKKNKGAFERFYKIKIDDGLNSYEILEELGRLRGHLKKGGEVDEMRTSDMIIMDWQNGGLRL